MADEFEDIDSPEYAITPNTLDRDMQRHAAEVAYWHLQHASHVTDVASLKIQIMRMRSEKYISLRQLAEAAGAKVTEKTLEARLDGDEQLRDLVDTHTAAEADARASGVACSALKVKGDMLTGLNLRRNAELRSAGMGT